MRTFKWIYVLILATRADANKTLWTQDGISDELEPRIVNGREALDGEFPWMVALHFRGDYFCGSFLLSPNFVMTAAHCVDLDNGVEPASDFYGIVGNIRRQGPETRIDFSEVVTHTDYAKTRGGDGDIAILRTTRPVIFSARVKPICLPAAGKDFDSVDVQIMGWGWTSTYGRDPPEILQTTPLGVQTRVLCRIFFGFFLVSITDRHLCASSSDASGVCFGDSGGPLVYKDPQSDQPMAIGVAAFITVFGCGHPFLPNVFTATSQYTDWIEDVTGKDSGICFV